MVNLDENKNFVFLYDKYPTLVGKIQDFYEELTVEDIAELSSINIHNHNDMMMCYHEEYEIAIENGILTEAERYLLLIISLIVKKIKNKYCKKL